MFENAQVGDRVWGFTEGWGNITRINKSSNFPIEVEFDNDDTSFTIDGKKLIEDINPSLFWNEIKFDIPAPPKRKVKKYRG